jgi:hypothetical protein
MEENVGKTDKIARIALAVVFAVLGYMYSPWLYLITVMLGFTAATGKCWPYKLLGINTSKKKR